jgi:transcriptional accessory protein Tex/SPT6
VHRAKRQNKKFENFNNGVMNKKKLLKKISKLERLNRELRNDIHALIDGDILEDMNVRLKYRLNKQAENMLWQGRVSLNSDGFAKLIQNYEPQQNNTAEQL